MHGKIKSRNFEFSLNGQLIASISYVVPWKFEPSRASIKVNAGEQKWIDQCEFPLYQMPSIIQFEDEYSSALEISVVSEIISVESLGVIAEEVHLLKAAKMHLTRTQGFFNKYIPQTITIFSDTPITRQLSSVKYAINHKDFGKDTVGYYIPLGKNHLLHLHFSYLEKNYESLKGYREYTLAFTEKIIQSLVIKLNVPVIQTDGAIVDQEETMMWDQFLIPCRYELERQLLRAGKVNQSDCYHMFNEESLKADWVVIENRKKNFLSKEVLVPSLDFKNFEGKISIPESNSPENPVEKEIARLIDEKTEALKNYLKRFEMPNLNN